MGKKGGDACISIDINALRAKEKLKLNSFLVYLPICFLRIKLE